MYTWRRGGGMLKSRTCKDECLKKDVNKRPTCSYFRIRMIMAEKVYGFVNYGRSKRIIKNQREKNKTFEKKRNVLKNGKRKAKNQKNEYQRQK